LDGRGTIHLAHRYRPNLVNPVVRLASADVGAHPLVSQRVNADIVRKDNLSSLLGNRPSREQHDSDDNESSLHDLHLSVSASQGGLFVFL